VFAAGDVANPFHPVLQRHVRSEHWANALNAGKVVARSMLGKPASFDDIPYFYTDQYDLGMELSGYAPLMTDAEIVVRGDLAAREFIAFWVDDRRVVAGMNVNVWDVNDKVQELIRSGARLDLERLQDPGVPLDSLLS
jgi:3-phenylpropionate/trans-cinnamate dioxygenase ferredoxin reductase subunit